MLESGDMVRFAPPDEPLAAVCCPLCGGSDAAVRLHGRDRLFGLPGHYPVQQCRACDLRYLSPRPTLSALSRHYPDNYLPSRLPDATPPLLRRLTGVLMAMRWIKYLRRLERVIGRLPAETRVVDVGCGLNGLLISLKRRRGCRGLGIDFNPVLCDYIRDRLGMEVAQGTLQDAGLSAGSVDLITMNEYLEHEPEPAAVLREARRISRPGGHLVVEVPYSGGLAARVFGARWSQLDVPRHLVFYTPQTLAEMLRRCGYRLIHVEPFAAPFSLSLSLLQAMGWDHLGAMRGVDVALIALLGTLTLPVFPLLPEFMFAVAKAD